jgi:hypothetical protein
MATTTNYSFPTPDDTALVKDGASAIRSLGSAVDTTVKALNPGTTAGDLDYYTTSTAKARVGIGTAGQLLRVNSGATAPEWATISTGGMTLISTTTISNAEVLLSSIPATYNDLVIVIRDYLPTTDAQPLRLRINDDSNANRHTSTVAVTASMTFDSTQFQITETSDNTLADGLYIITIPDYANTTTFKWTISDGIAYNSDGTTLQGRFTRGAYNQTGAISSLRFLNLTNVPKSGTILLYGVK